MELLTTSLNPIEASFFEWLRIYLEAVGIRMPQFSLDEDYEGFRIEDTLNEYYLRLTEIESKSLLRNKTVSALSLERGFEIPGDRWTPPDYDFEEIAIHQSPIALAKILSLEIVRNRMDAAADHYAEDSISF